MSDPELRRLENGVLHRPARIVDALVLVQDKLDRGIHMRLDRGAADLAIALGEMRVSRPEQRALAEDRIEHRGARKEFAVIHVPAKGARRDGVNPAILGRADPGRAEMHAEWHGNALWRRDTRRMVDRRVAPGDRLFRAVIFEAEDRTRDVLVDVRLVDDDMLLAVEFLIEHAPIGEEVDAIGEPWRGMEEAAFQRVARLRILDIDRAGQEVDARTAILLRDMRIDLPDHIIHDVVMGVTGMVAETFDLDIIAGSDLQNGLGGAVEISPLDGVDRCRKVMDVVHPGSHLRRFGRGDRSAIRPAGFWNLPQDWLLKNCVTRTHLSLPVLIISRRTALRAWRRPLRSRQMCR